MVNTLIYQGRITKDLELKQTSSDITYTEFTIAWSEKYKESETKCFLRCKAWRSTAEFLSKYFFKGKEIAINGHLVTEEWEKEGQKQSRMICVVDKVHFCGSSKSDGSGSADVPSDDFINVPEEIDKELPFNT
jgi:single-strand DNA-binding protein